MATEKRRYRSTESKYKGTAREMYVTYDRKQKTRSGKEAIYPKVKRVYIAGEVKNWKTDTFTRRTGREVHGVMIEYEQDRRGYRRAPSASQKELRSSRAPQIKVKPTVQKFKKIVEVPEKAQNIRFHDGELPEKYQDALQDVR